MDTERGNRAVDPATDGRYQALLSQRREQILARIARAAEAAGRSPQDIRLIAVSKTVDIPQVMAAIGAGYSDFGENRPQELQRKCAGLPGQAPAQAPAQGQPQEQRPNPTFHMIGNLQTNKINMVLRCRPALIHSVSSVKLAQAISRRAQEMGLMQPVLFEVNVSGEQSKSGMGPEELAAAFETLMELPGIEARGLMTMAPQAGQEVAARTFEGLRTLFEQLRGCLSASHIQGFSELSMGMSGDFEAAIAQGATMVRIGRAVFDPGYPFEAEL